jgi:hypothetical protein
MLESYLPNLIAHTSLSIDCADLQCSVNTKVSNQPVGLMIASPVIHKQLSGSERITASMWKLFPAGRGGSPTEHEKVLVYIPPIVNFNYGLHKYSIQLVL